MIQNPPEHLATAAVGGPVAIVGNGRMGQALAAALTAAGVAVTGPHGRGATGADAQTVLLAVPDAAVADAAAHIAAGPFVGHVSGSLGLDVLGSHAGFSLHPLMTVTAHGADFAGVSAAVDASSDAALDVATGLARALGMSPLRVRPDDRVAYHAAASIASNFLVTLEGMAEALAATAGIPREALMPLVRASVENWAELGAEAALTGPIVRGDTQTVARQRVAMEDRMPQALPLFDALVAATADLAARRGADASTTQEPSTA